MDIRRLVYRIADALGPEADPAQIEAVTAAVLDVAMQKRSAPAPALTEEVPFAIRTITLGLSLFECSSPLPQTVRARVYDKIRRTAAYHASVVEDVTAAAEVQVEQTTVAVTPIALVAGKLGRNDLIGLAHILDAAADHVGVDYLCGFSALADQGFTEGDRRMIAALPMALATTKRVCGSITCGSSMAGIHAEAVQHAAEVLSETAGLTSDGAAAGGMRFAALYNAAPSMPFAPGAFHPPGAAEATITVGVSAMEAIRYGLRSVKTGAPLAQVQTAVIQAAFTITRASERIGRACAERLDQHTGRPITFGGVSLALPLSTDEQEGLRQVQSLLEPETIGASGTAASLALLEAVQTGAMLAQERVGILWDARVAGTSTETIAGLLLDAISVSRPSNTMTACRLVPVPGTPL